MDDMLGKEARLWGEKLVVIRNDANLGFVKTANRGIRYDDQADIVLLNNDVILPDRWLERLLDDVDALADAGTVTPLSNNTTISSFPNFVAENPYPLQLDLDRIDEAFQVARLNPVDAPTGIGFCMYIKRQCLTEVGELNDGRSVPVTARRATSASERCKKVGKVIFRRISMCITGAASVLVISERSAYVMLIKRSTAYIRTITLTFRRSLLRMNFVVHDCSVF